MIQIKTNALEDPGITEALYRASQAGVRIDLIVRGICALRPGLPGVSDNIRVRSVVGRFLEHSRVFHFHAGGQDRVWCASADWMSRNLLHRVEVAFPIEDEALKRRVLDESIDVYLADDTHAWELSADGTYHRTRPSETNPVSAQDLLLARLAPERS